MKETEVASQGTVLFLRLAKLSIKKKSTEKEKTLR